MSIWKSFSNDEKNGLFSSSLILTSLQTCLYRMHSMIALKFMENKAKFEKKIKKIVNKS